MRSLIVLLAVLVASPAYAQRVFRASIKIDDIQNERLDEVEAKVDNLNETVKVLVQTVNTLAEVQRQRIEVSKLELQAEAQPKPKVVSTKVVSHTTAPPQEIATTPTPRAATNLAAIAWQAYPDGVYRVRYADVQPRSQVWNHLIQHGFSQEEVQGLSQFEALAIHDLAHGGKIHPRQSYSAPVQSSVRQPVAQVQSGCANGQCARQGVSYSYSRPRLFGLFR